MRGQVRPWAPQSKARRQRTRSARAMPKHTAVPKHTANWGWAQRQCDTAPNKAVELTGKKLALFPSSSPLALGCSRWSESRCLSLSGQHLTVVIASLHSFSGALESLQSVPAKLKALLDLLRPRRSLQNIVPWLSLLSCNLPRHSKQRSQRLLITGQGTTWALMAWMLPQATLYILSQSSLTSSEALSVIKSCCISFVKRSLILDGNRFNQQPCLFDCEMSLSTTNRNSVRR